MLHNGWFEVWLALLRSPDIALSSLDMREAGLCRLFIATGLSGDLSMQLCLEKHVLGEDEEVLVYRTLGATLDAGLTLTALCTRCNLSHRVVVPNAT